MRSKITPFDIAKTPFRIEIQDVNYSHDEQRSLGITPQMSGYQTNSFGGTQTFGGSGRPSDSDNDTDRNQ